MQRHITVSWRGRRRRRSSWRHCTCGHRPQRAPPARRHARRQPDRYEHRAADPVERRRARRHDVGDRQHHRHRSVRRRLPRGLRLRAHGTDDEQRQPRDRHRPGDERHRARCRWGLVHPRPATNRCDRRSVRLHDCVVHRSSRTGTAAPLARHPRRLGRRQRQGCVEARHDVGSVDGEGSGPTAERDRRGRERHRHRQRVRRLVGRVPVRPGADDVGDELRGPRDRRQHDDRQRRQRCVAVRA